MSIISKNIENLKPNKEYIVTVRAKNNDINVLSEYTDSVRFRTPTDSTIPQAPTGLVLAASFLNVLFKYTDSVDEDTAKYEYELYKQAQIQVVGGQYQVIASATPSTPHRTGFVQTNVFVVSVDDNSTTTSTSGPPTNPVKYYGRVRSIDSAGNISSWTNIVESGDTPLIDEASIGSLTAGKITAGTIGAHEIILTQPGTATSIETPNNKAILRSSDYNGEYNNLTNTWSAGSTGWIISGDGRAEFNNATIRGTLQFIDGSAPGSIYYGATQPSIPSPFTAKLISAISGNGTSVTYTTGTTAHGLSVGKIVSLNHVIPSQYNLKNQYVTAVTTYTFTVTSSATGTFILGNSPGAEVVAGQIPEYSIWYNSTSGDNKSYIYSSSAWNESLGNVSNLNPQNQTQTGLIAGTTITGGGITLNAGGNIKGGQTAYDTGTGFFLGYASSAYRFSIGNSGGNKLTWDGTNLSVTGTINAAGGTFSGSITASGTISGGTISGATVTGGTVQTAASGQRIVLSGTTFNLYAAGSGDTSTIAFYPAATTNYGLMTSTGGLKIAAQGATLSIGYSPTDLGTTGVRLESGAYFQVLNGSIDIRRNTTTTDWATANLILRANSGNDNTSIAFKANETNNNATAQIRVGGGANYFYFRNYNDTANVRIIAAEAIFGGTINASDVNSANIIIDSTAANVSLGFKASSGTYSAQIRMGGSNQLYFTEGLNSAVGIQINAAAFVPFSDYRIKENFEPINNPCILIKKLNPLKYNYTHKPDVQAIGFIAHEVQEFLSCAVRGVKDEVSEAGEPVYQGLDYNQIIPVITAAVKEIIERLEIIENK